MKETGATHAEVQAAEFKDSVGIGSYRIDLHFSTGGNNAIDISSLPFQIPLGALLPQRVENLLPACTEAVGGVLPADWQGFTAQRIFRGVRYEISVKRSDPGNTPHIMVDGTAIMGNVLPLPSSSTKSVKVTVTLA